MGLHMGSWSSKLSYGFEVDESLVVLVVLLGLCTVGTDAEYAVAQAKVLAFAVELVQVGKMAVVDFDHPVEQTPAEAVDEGLALPVRLAHESTRLLHILGVGCHLRWSCIH